MSTSRNKRAGFVLDLVKDALHVSLLAVLLFLLVSNWRSFDLFVDRFLRNAVEISVADVITVAVPQNGGRTAIQNWAAFYRTTDRLRVDQAAFDDESTGVEYVDLTAVADIDLRDAYIGDGDEMLLIEEGDFFIHTGETVRIYTFVALDAESTLLPGEARSGGKKVLVARPLSGKLDDGIFKTKRGKGDRLVVIDRNQHILLDLDYWWVQKPAE